MDLLYLIKIMAKTRGTKKPVTGSAKAAAPATTPRYRRWLGSRSATVLFPLLLVTVFCFGYVQYRTVQAKANCAPKAAAQSSKTDTTPAAPITANPPSSVSNLSVVNDTPVNQSTITGSYHADVVTNSFDPNQADTSPLQAHGNGKQSGKSDLQAPAGLPVDMSNL